MQVNVEELSPILRRLSVELPVELVDQAFDRAYRAVGRKAKLKGFRPGKVPRRVLERFYSEQVEHEVADELVRDSYPVALDQGGVEPVSYPDVQGHLHAHPGKPFSYVVQVEVLAPVKATDYKALALEVELAAAADVSAAVDQEIERIAESMTQLAPVEGREEVQAGDYVIADVAAQLEGKPYEAASGEGLTLSCEEGAVFEGKIGAAAGRSLGETFGIEHTLPDDFPDELVRGKTLAFEVSLKSLREKVTPEIDDELALSLGEEGVDDLAGLRAHIAGRIEAARDQEREHKVRDALMEKLVEANPIDAPAALIERTAEQMSRPFVENLIRAGFSPEELSKNEGVQRLFQDMQPRAEIVVKGALLLEAIAGQESIEVSEADLEAHYAELAEDSGQHVEKVKARFEGDAGELRGLKRRLVENKTVDFLLKGAKITEIAPGEGAASAGGSEGEAPKKKAAKKAPAKKAAAKKATTKKSSTKKAPAKKAAAKKTSSKKATSKKAGAEKSEES